MSAVTVELAFSKRVSDISIRRSIALPPAYAILSSSSNTKNCLAGSRLSFFMRRIRFDVQPNLLAMARHKIASDLLKSALIRRTFFRGMFKRIVTGWTGTGGKSASSAAVTAAVGLSRLNSHTGSPSHITCILPNSKPITHHSLVNIAFRFFSRRTRSAVPVKLIVAPM